MLKSIRTLVQVLVPSVAVVAMVACGPDGGSGGDDDDDPFPDAGVDSPNNPNCTNPVPEVCNNGMDDDCDNIGDCDDADCSADSHCSNPNCGILETPSGSLALPDGACPKDETQPCAGYENSLNFTGFSSGQTLNDITKLNGICVNMEHSWMRDLVIYAQCPSGVRVMMHDFVGQTGGEVYLGEPNDFDTGANPVPGVGYDYCWTPEATNANWIEYANSTGVDTIPAGDYQAAESMNAFLGCPLNGLWTIRVEDRWGIDNGYIFNWSVRFDPSIVEDCSMWPD